MPRLVNIRSYLLEPTPSLRFKERKQTWPVGQTPKTKSITMANFYLQAHMSQLRSKYSCKAIRLRR